MSDNSQNVPVVDVNTDNLDDFSKLMFGEATVAEPAEPVKEEKVNEEVHDKDAEEDSLATETDEAGSEPTEEDLEDEEPEAELKAKPKSKSRFQERIDQLTHQNKETQRQLDLALNKLNEVADKPKPKVEASESPKPDDKSDDGEDKYPLGEFDPLFIRDLTRFTIQQETVAARLEDEDKNKAKELEEARTALHSEWAGKLEKARETYPNLSEQNAALGEAFSGVEANYGEYLASTIMSLDYGVDVLNYLGNNIEEARRIIASGPTKATIALGRLEARFVEAAEEKATKKPRQSSAPEPPPSMTRGSGTKSGIAADTDDLDAFEKMFYAKK